MMDKKKAADLLDNLVGMVEDSHGADYDTALRMGIEALSANGDTIYRQAAIDGVKTLHDVAWKNWHEPTLSANVVLDMIRELPSAQPETEERTDESSQNVPNDDLISRRAAIEALENTQCELLPEEWDELTNSIIAVPSAQPDIDEWCTDCKEYDAERHCCPRWNRVIRQTLKDMKEARPEIIYCKDCLHNGSFDTDCPIEWNGKEYCSFAERRTDETTI